MNGIEHTAKCAAMHMGPWMIEARWFLNAIAALRAGTLALAHNHFPTAGVEGPELEANVQGARRRPYHIDQDGIATIKIAGQMTKGDSKYGGTNSIRTRQAVREASDDRDVKGVMLAIDSPGGTVAGTAALAADVAAIPKPTHAFIEDLGASAAYWIASQADQISVNPTGEVGSIGTVAVVDDESGKYEAEGIKVHVISTGPYKGAFVPGAEVKEDHLDWVREVVGDMNDRFLQGVGNGRKMSEEAVKAIATGRTWVGKAAQEIGLVDSVMSADDAYGHLASIVDTTVASERAAARVRTANAEARVRLAKETC